jgi:hypothetical protein
MESRPSGGRVACAAGLREDEGWLTQLNQRPLEQRLWF